MVDITSGISNITAGSSLTGQYMPGKDKDFGKEIAKYLDVKHKQIEQASEATKLSLENKADPLDTVIKVNEMSLQIKTMLTLHSQALKLYEKIEKIM